MSTLAHLESSIRLRVRATATGCWLWQGSKTKSGYAEKWCDGKAVRLHREVYRRLVGQIPEGLELDHTCPYKHCINPEHLDLITPAKHRKLTGARKSACINGHEYTPENTIMNSAGHRCCRTCREISNRGRYTNEY